MPKPIIWSTEMRADIEKTWLAGESAETIGRRWHMDPDTVRRYAKKNLARRCQYQAGEWLKCNWTDERIAQLKEMQARGLSASEIGRQLGKSRNAILGKLHRLGLSNGEKPKVINGGSRPTKKGRKPVRVRDLESVPQKPLPPPPTPQSDMDIPLQQRRAFWQLGPTTCRWPVGEGAEIFYCGAEPELGFPYCHAHCRRAYTFMPRAA